MSICSNILRMMRDIPRIHYVNSIIFARTLPKRLMFWLCIPLRLEWRPSPHLRFLFRRNRSTDSLRNHSAHCTKTFKFHQSNINDGKFPCNFAAKNLVILWLCAFHFYKSLFTACPSLPRLIAFTLVFLSLFPILPWDIFIGPFY